MGIEERGYQRNKRRGRSCKRGENMRGGIFSSTGVGKVLEIDDGMMELRRRWASDRLVTDNK